MQNFTYVLVRIMMMTRTKLFYNLTADNIPDIDTAPPLLP